MALHVLPTFPSRRRTRCAGAALLTAVSGAPAALAQGMPEWSGLGTIPGAGVFGAALVSGRPGFPQTAHLAVGGFAHSGGPLFGYAEPWNGWRWSTYGADIPNGSSVEDVAAPGAATGAAGAQVTIGGRFFTVGGQPVQNIACWHLGQWWEPGGGIDDSVYTLLWTDALPPGLALFAGGSLDTAGGAPARALARWDGAAWSAIPGELAPPTAGQTVDVKSLAIFDDDGIGARPIGLYVGGRFKFAGGVTVNSIARWDGISWEPLGVGIASTSPEALCVFDHDGQGPARESLFVGGPFIDAGGLQTNGLGRWDGTEWHTLPGWIGSIVYALAVFDDDGPGPNKTSLFVGGAGVNATGAPLNRIARWDGQQWFPLAGGVSQPNFGQPEVFTLEVFDEDGPGPNPGGLYVGGWFNVAGTIQAPGIARWGCALPPRCDTNCSRDFHPVTGQHILTIADFACFQTRYVLADPFADCNGDTALTIADFGCFQTKFVAGCP